MGASTPGGDKPRARKAGVARCPICSAPTELGFRPFCSRRCADVDLSRWLRGAYAIPGRVDVDEDGDDTAAAAAVRRSPAAGGDEGDESGR